MNDQGRKWAAVLILLLLALPTGVCSLFFTPTGAMMLFERDILTRDVGGLMLVCSAVGWVFCLLMIWFARRLTRPANDGSPNEETAP